MCKLGVPVYVLMCWPDRYYNRIIFCSGSCNKCSASRISHHLWITLWCYREITVKRLKILQRLNANYSLFCHFSVP